MKRRKRAERLRSDGKDAGARSACKGAPAKARVTQVHFALLKLKSLWTSVPIEFASKEVATTSLLETYEDPKLITTRKFALTFVFNHSESNFTTE